MNIKMRSKLALLLLVLASLLLLLSACGGGDGGNLGNGGANSDTNPLPGTGGNNSGGSPGPQVAYPVATVSGSFIPLDGNYQSQCHLSDDGLAHLIFSLDITGNSFVMSLNAYSNDTCTGAPVATDNAEFSFSTSGTTIATTGWVDASGSATLPPNASDGSGPLSENETVTVIDFEVTSAGLIFTLGQIGQTFAVVDDTGAKLVLYLAANYPMESTVETVPTYTQQ